MVGLYQGKQQGSDDPQYHNHDPNEDVDEEWFQGRDGWDQISLIKK